MNWEKLFSKVMSNKGHGRRWKFLIETIKQKAKLGWAQLQIAWRIHVSTLSENKRNGSHKYFEVSDSWKQLL